MASIPTTADVDRSPDEAVGTDAAETSLAQLFAQQRLPDAMNAMRTWHSRKLQTEIALAFAERLGVRPVFTGHEADTAWLVDCQEAFRLFGQPKVTLDRMIDWTADWVQRGGASLGKPTHYEARDGKY